MVLSATVITQKPGVPEPRNGSKEWLTPETKAAPDSMYNLYCPSLSGVKNNLKNTKVHRIMPDRMLGILNMME